MSGTRVSVDTATALLLSLPHPIRDALLDSARGPGDSMRG